MTRRVVVSGSASGIGKALAKLLEDQGDEVIGVDLRDATVEADLATERGRVEAVETVLEAAGGAVDGVAACAGLSVPDPRSVRVNFFGTTALLAGLRPALAEAPAPRAVVVGSISGTRPADDAVIRACLNDGEPEAVARAERLVAEEHGGRLYPSSKAALARWVRGHSVSEEWAGQGIALNVVAPGVVRTPMSEALFADERMRAVMEGAVPMPLNGYAAPEVVAEILRWFVGPENSHVTGQVLYVDGGAEATLRGPEVY